MPTYVPDNFDIGASAPADSRVVKATIAARNSIPMGVRFEGLAVYVIAEKKTYQLQDGKDDTKWVDISGGGSSSAATLLDLYDTNISNLSNYDKLIYDTASTKWINSPEVFILNPATNKVTTTPGVVDITTTAPLINTAGGLHVSGGDRIAHLLATPSGEFKIETEDVASGDILPLIRQTSDGKIYIGGTLFGGNNVTADWAMQLESVAPQDGLLITVDHHQTTGLRVVSEEDGPYINSSFMQTWIGSPNLTLGAFNSENHGDLDRDFVANFDNVSFSLGSSGTTGFRVIDTYVDSKTTFQLFEGSGIFHMSEGINQSATKFNGYIEVEANDVLSEGPIGTGYITAEDFIKTNTYFEGDSVFNHNTLLLTDSTGPNCCRVAEVAVQENEYVTLELDYTLPNSSIGINKGRVLMQVGFNPDGQTTQTSEIPVTTTQETPYDIDDGDTGIIGILNTNGGTNPPFDTGDEIRIAPFLSGQLVTLEYLPGLTGTYYKYRVLGYTNEDFLPFVGEDILHDVTEMQTVTTTQTGESFVTSLFDIKDKATGESGVIWKAVLNSTGPIKTMSLFAQLTIDDTFLSYIAKYQKEGDPIINLYDEQAWGSSLPSGTSQVDAVTTVGSSYWNAAGTTLYNSTNGNVAIGKTSAETKLDVDGELSVDDAIVIRSGDSIVTWDELDNPITNVELTTVTTITLTNPADITTGTNIRIFSHGDFPFVATRVSSTEYSIPTNIGQAYADTLLGTNLSVATQQPGSAKTIISASNVDNTVLTVKNAFVSNKDLLNISNAGNIHINSSNNTSNIAKLNITADANSTFGLKVQSSSSAGSAATFYGGAFNDPLPIVEFRDYLGQYIGNITGAGILDINQGITVNYGVILSVTNDHFTYQGNDVWCDGSTGSIGDLANVDMTGLSVNSTIKWDGTNWVPSPLTEGTTNLSYIGAPSEGTIVSDTGDNAVIPVATIVNAGLMSNTDKDKLNGIAQGAEVNVQSDWAITANTSDAYIANKPTSLSNFIDDLGAVSHIADSVIHVTQADKDLWNLGEANIQADWNETDSNNDSFIQNKPSLSVAASMDVDSVVTVNSPNLITSGGVALSLDNLEISPSTGFIRFGDTTIRLSQGSTVINITDVPKLDTDGKLLMSQTRTLVGGATHVYQTTGAFETAVTGGTTIPKGDFVYIADALDPNKAMWIAAVDLTGAGWVFDDAKTAYDIIDITTGANSYTQTQIDGAFVNQEIAAGDGLEGGGTLAFDGSTTTVSVKTGNGTKINDVDKSIELDELVGTPTGSIYTP